MKDCEYIYFKSCIMKQVNDFNHCKNLINKFVDEYLKGDINAFLDFDFASLQQDKRLGCNGRSFDCDDTNLTRAICYLLWGEIFPDMTLSDIGTGKKYRGDTLNTFHTVLGTYFPEQNSCIGIERSNAPEKLRVIADKFHTIYHSIGNFILLPNISETDKKRAYTFNTYRGIAYKDYFDLFLQQLYGCLTSTDGDKHLSALIERNSQFFSWLKTNGGLKFFADICWLQDYFSDDKPKAVFTPYVYCLRKKQEWTEFEKSQYIENAETYIKTATAIIKRRALKMIEQLSIKCR